MDCCECAGVAQLAEQLLCKQQVVGSSPTASSQVTDSGAVATTKSGGVPERSKGPDCKSGGSAFEGSNPSPTMESMKVASTVTYAGVAQMVEHQPSKLRVAGSNPVSRFAERSASGADCPHSSVVEHFHGKEGVPGSSPGEGFLVSLVGEAIRPRKSGK